MASKKSKKTVIVRLVPEEGIADYFYTTKRSAKLPHKLRLRKYHPKRRCHMWFIEKKIK